MGRIKAVKARGLSAVQMAAAAIPAYDAPLAGLEGADVHLFLVESYGMTLYQHPEHSKRFRPMREGFLSDLGEAGFHMVSSCLRSPTFGGTSWLAFGTLESGVWVSDQLRYHFLLNSRVRPMAAYFREAGYRTVSVMPGTTLPWPEGAFFQYEQPYYAKDLDYQGPSFGWSPMADQFVLNRIRRWEIQPGHRPLFARYVLISTHAPFHIQPPYVPDWEVIGDGSVYHRLAPVTYPINWPDLTRAGGAFVRSMGYELDVLEDFLTRFVEREALVIIMGDHQPNAQITGDDAPWLVPVHAVSSNPSLLVPFIERGYEPGMVPADLSACRGMDEFLPNFMADFSR